MANRQPAETMKIPTFTPTTSRAHATGHVILLILLALVAGFGYFSYRTWDTRRKMEKMEKEQSEVIARLDPVLQANINALRSELEAADRRVLELRQLGENLQTTAGKAVLETEVAAATRDRDQIASKLDQAQAAVEQIFVRQQAARAGAWQPSRQQDAVVLGRKVESEARALRDSLASGTPSPVNMPTKPAPPAPAVLATPASPPVATPAPVQAPTPASPASGQRPSPALAAAPDPADFARHFLEVMARADAQAIISLLAPQVRDFDSVNVPAGHTAWRHVSASRAYATRVNHPGAADVARGQNGEWRVTIAYTAERIHHSGVVTRRPATLELFLRPEPEAPHGYKVLAWKTNE
jgi:hypothetical protein